MDNDLELIGEIITFLIELFVSLFIHNIYLYVHNAVVQNGGKIETGFEESINFRKNEPHKLVGVICRLAGYIKMYGLFWISTILACKIPSRSS